MFYIFNFSVCRRWNFLIRDDQLWTEIDAGAGFLNLKENGRFVDRKNLSEIEKKTLKLINIYACATTRQVCLFNPSNRILRLLRKRCPNLDAINLTMKFKEDYKNLKLHILGTELTKFRLEPSPPRYYPFCGNVGPSFHTSDLPFPKLRVLRLVSTSINNKVFTGLHTIRCLTLSRCYLQHVQEGAYFESLSTVLENLSCLEALHLTMAHFHFGLDFSRGFSRFFEVLCDRKTLRCLQLKGLMYVETGLGHVNFENSIESVLEIITIKLGNTLCSLSIDSIDDAVIRIIANNLHKLQFVNLSRSSKITDSGFALFSGHPCLEVVDITDCEQITYNAIAMTIDTLPRIKKLFVTDYPERTELDWVQFNQVRHRMNHLRVDIKLKWTYDSRDTCRYCDIEFR